MFPILNTLLLAALQSIFRPTAQYFNRKKSLFQNSPMWKVTHVKCSSWLFHDSGELYDEHKYEFIVVCLLELVNKFHGPHVHSCHTSMLPCSAWIYGISYTVLPLYWFFKISAVYVSSVHLMQSGQNGVVLIHVHISWWW